MCWITTPFTEAQFLMAANTCSVESLNSLQSTPIGPHKLFFSCHRLDKCIHTDHVPIINKSHNYNQCLFEPTGTIKGDGNMSAYLNTLHFFRQNKGNKSLIPLLSKRRQAFSSRMSRKWSNFVKGTPAFMNADQLGESHWPGMLVSIIYCQSSSNISFSPLLPHYLCFTFFMIGNDTTLKGNLPACWTKPFASRYSQVFIGNTNSAYRCNRVGVRGGAE